MYTAAFLSPPTQVTAPYLTMHASSRLLLCRLAHLTRRIGNTPIWHSHVDGIDYSFKIEWQQLGGSIKIRPALFMLGELIKEGKIDSGSTVIESSSGNLAVGLAIACFAIDVPFIAVIDPSIAKCKELLLTAYGARLMKVSQRDETGAYLLNRLRAVSAYIASEPCAVNPNQYKNENNHKAYYTGLGPELRRQLQDTDAVFISVSSGGTIAGLSMYIKEVAPWVAVVAVDVEGSVIFQDTPRPRRFSGIGAAIKSEQFSKAEIDRIVILTEAEIRHGFYELVKRCSICGGVSTGAAFAAARKYARTFGFRRCLVICPDAGQDYLEYI